uniref:Uncharacterized protein n=1 Tax=Sphaerodactylus townsendi TaxID=933632 RepID=A0ACB8FSX8_9SAUR
MVRPERWLQKALVAAFQNRTLVARAFGACLRLRGARLASCRSESRWFIAGPEGTAPSISSSRRNFEKKELPGKLEMVEYILVAVGSNPVCLLYDLVIDKMEYNFDVSLSRK